jgi:hypothetical protein
MEMAMRIPSRSAFTAAVLVPLVLVHAPQTARAQTAAQMEYDRQQREYRQQQEQARQEQERLQQQMNENARRQQEESKRMNAPSGQGQTQGYPDAGRPMLPQQAGPQADALEAARRNWQKQPPLPAERNPLLGRWTRPAASRGNSTDPFAQLSAMAKGGLCEVVFGDGVFEFRVRTLVGIDQRQHEQELDEVEYRGDARRVAVIPKTTFKLMLFEFDGPNRINWAGQNCVLVRASAASALATPAVAPGVGPRTGETAAATGAGVFTVAVGISEGAKGVTPMADRDLWVLKDPVEAILTGVGVKPPPYGSVLQSFVSACKYRFPVCERGMQAIKARSVGTAKTDAAGSARIPPLPPGPYHVFADAVLDNRVFMWDVPIQLTGGENMLTLDQRNAKSSE